MNDSNLPIVLVVDDEILHLRMLAALLARQYCPLTVSSGREALRVLEHLRLSGELHLLRAVLLDIMMPEIDGLAVLDTIRKRYQHNVRVIMCSALSMKGTVVRSRMLGADDYLLKPYDHEVLIQKLARLGSSEGETYTCEALER